MFLILRYTLCAGAMVAIATTAQAQLFIRAPFVRVQTGPFGGVRVNAPFVTVDTMRYGSNPYVIPVSGQPLVTPAPNYQPPASSQPQQPQQLPSLPPGAQPLPQGQTPPVISVPRQPAPVNPNQPNVPVIPNQAVPAQPNLPVLPPPSPLPTQVVPQPGVFVISQPMTHQEFARRIPPRPGRYEVNFIHPGIHRKVVHVSFNLPPGNPRVRTAHRRLEFDYGRCQVEVHFRLFGRVSVDYD